jgi:hypothetical protein
VVGKELRVVLLTQGTVCDHSIAKDDLIQAIEAFLMDSLGSDRKGKERS